MLIEKIVQYSNALSSVCKLSRFFGALRRPMVELTGATRNQLREERFLASEASSFGERFWRAKRGIQYTQKIFGKRSEPLGEQFWRVKRSVISP